MTLAGHDLPVMPPPASSLAYHHHRDALVVLVDAGLAAHPDLLRFLGPNGYDLLALNHGNHAKFMDNVFFLSAPKLLADTLPWVYRTYGARGVDPDYFLAELEAWRQAIRTLIPGPEAGPLLDVYNWITAQHGTSLRRAAEAPASPDGAPPDLEAFIEALLQGDRGRAEALAGEHLARPEHLERFYLELLDPALARIGALWEEARITVVQEHLASSLATRIMSAAFSRLESRPSPRKRCIVCAGPGEQHHIGAWMLSDLLEMRGWNCRFPGADTPADALVALVKEFQPAFLALSLTMPFNLRAAADLIARLRREAGPGGPRVMVGGRVFRNAPDLAASLGADGEAADAREACLLAESWLGDDRGSS